MNASNTTIGILMLDTRFPRLIGDIGNPKTFKSQTLYRVVKGASPKRVVQEQSPALLRPFVDAGHELVNLGAGLITTSCGFLAMFQRELQDALPVPVFTSSLLLMSELETKFGKGSVGILTISGTSLSPEFCDRVGIPKTVPIGTTEKGQEFTQAILENREAFDVDQCRQDNVNTALTLVEANPELKAILLECTNMPPYADDISMATGLPVYSLNTLLEREVNAAS